VRNRLAELTSARVGVGRVGASLPISEVLRLGSAHAEARDAVHAAINPSELARDIRALHIPAFDLAAMPENGATPGVITVTSAARDRQQYLQRPDLGRTLDAGCRSSLALDPPPELVFVIADGLSALAVTRHAVPMLAATLPLLRGWRIGPVVIATQARVALGDEIGEAMGAKLCVILIGERPGLSSPDSLGAYLTYQPRSGRTDAERNCISNIRPEGLPYEAAALRLSYLLNESRRIKLSGVPLKERSGELGAASPPSGPRASLPQSS